MVKSLEAKGKMNKKTKRGRMPVIVGIILVVLACLGVQSLIDNCERISIKSGHDIHLEHPDVFISACEKLINKKFGLSVKQTDGEQVRD
jgi:hypothetical protein